MTEISVGVAATAAEYPVIVGAGAIAQLSARLSIHAPASRYVLIVDENLTSSVLPDVSAELERARIEAVVLRTPAGEAAKTRQTWAELTDAMIARHVGRDSAVLALGGGTVGDVAGFVAATYMRGIALVQLPTTLLAMVDASVGGKTGVDTPAAKNLVGAFHSPRLVIADTALLGALPQAQLIAGLAEAVKHAAIADATHLAWIGAAASQLAARDARKMAELVATSVRIKAGIVAADPFEAGERAVLNFGHTVAHALEAASGYAIPHGEAVAMGMVAEAELGESLGVTAAGTSDTLRALLSSLGLPTEVPALDTGAVLAAAQHDKKARGGSVRVVLLAAAGAVARSGGGGWTHEVSADSLRRAIERCAAAKPLRTTGL